MPDLIDPPGNPFHRSIGHNFVSFFMFIIIFLIGIALSLIFKKWPGDWLFITTTSFALAVLSHLILDMTTPMGLPLFFGKSVLVAIGVPFDIIFALTPFLNIIGIVISIVFALISIRFLAKKIGGKLALILLFIPLWGTLLLLGIALLTVKWLVWLGVLLIILFIGCVITLILVGHAIDISLKKQQDAPKKKSKK